MKQQDILLNAAKEKVIQLQPTAPMNSAQMAVAVQNIKHQLAAHNAVLITHYYCSEDLQALTEETGGFIGDSLEMAKFGRAHQADTLIVAGVRFMGETAKILSPEKRVLMPDLKANCSLDLGCPADEFAAFCAEHPERTVVVYANTSAKVKALADWVVTSSIAVPVLEHLASQGKKILWGPDKHLGSYLQQTTGADMIMWNGSCIVHDTFKANALHVLKQQYPQAAILVHPESPAEVVAMADVVGSTSQLLKASHELPQQTIIVATERGIFYKMQQRSPHKQFLQAPAGGKGATCQSCIHCPWMALNDIKAVENTFKQIQQHEIDVAPSLAQKALTSLNRMMNFSGKSIVSVQKHSAA